MVEWACFENRYARKGIGGSNPPISARAYSSVAEHLICNEEAPVRFWLGPQTIKLLRSISEGLVGFSVLALLPHPEKL